MVIHRNIRLLAWFNFCLDFRLYGPVAILYFTQVAGSFALGMSVFSMAMLSSALLEVPTGILSDRMGRKKTMMAGAAAGIASVTCYAIGGTYIMLLLGALLEGLSRSFYSGNNDALLHDTLAETQQENAFQEYLGRVSSMYQVALAISGLLGSIIAYFSFPLVMWLSVIPQVGTLIISLWIIEPKVHFEQSGNIYSHLKQAFQNIIKNPRLRTFSAGSVLGFAIGESAFQFRAAFINTLWPVWAIGISRTISNFGAALSFYLAGRVIRRFGEFRIIMVSIPVSETINLIAYLMPTVVSPLLNAITSIFFGTITVSIGGLLQREFSSEQRATMGSLNAFAGSLAFAVFSFGLGWVADQIGPAPTLIICTLLMILPLGLYWRAFARHTQTPAVEPLI